MEITSDLAQNIVDKTMKILGYNINIMNSSGIIVGSGDKKRLNTFHEGAYKVINSSKPVEIYEEDSGEFRGAKPGINLPIMFKDNIVGVVGISGDPREVRHYGELLKMSVETMLQHFYLLNQIHLEKSAKENYINDLINENFGESIDMFEFRGWVFGFDMSLPRITMIITVDELDKRMLKAYNDYPLKKDEEFYIQKLKNRVLDCLEKFFEESNNKDIVAFIGGNRFVVLKTLPYGISFKNYKNELLKISYNVISTLKTQLKLESNIGIGSYYQGIKGLVKSYHEAVDALQIASKLKLYKNVYCIEDMMIEMLLNSAPQDIKKKFIRQIYSNLNKKDVFDNSLKETLKVFFECNLNISKAARALYIHRNTLIYRLDQIEKYTGRDPRKFRGAMELKLFLLIDEL